MHREQTRGEERVNAAIHGVGAALALAGLAATTAWAALHGDVWRIVAFAVYGTSLVLLYLASALYHAARDPRRKRLLNVLDHAAIFLLIAGTYTPFTLIALRGAWGWSLFGVVWGLAALGVVMKILFMDRWRPLAVAMYVALGWVAVVAIDPLLRVLPTAGLLWLLAGGLSYTAGVGFYLWRSRRWAHAVWHLFVLGGSAAHFVALAGYVLPMPA